MGRRRPPRPRREGLRPRPRLRHSGDRPRFVSHPCPHPLAQTAANIITEKADNFAPDYLKINPNGTVPSLTAPSLPGPLSDSVDILRYLDGVRPGTAPLVPQDADTRAKAQQVIDLVQSAQVSTNILFFNARSVAELDDKKRGWSKAFIDARQHRLVKEKAADAGHSFYGPKVTENGTVFDKYATPLGHADESFFAQSEEAYKGFAAGVAKLETLLVLPYAAGAALSEADFHVIAWLSHSMVAAGSDVEKVHDFSTLEEVVGKSVPGFAIGPRVRKWWTTVSEEASFKKVFPKLN